VNAWIRAHAHMYAKEYKQAIHTFRQLEEGTPFSNNSSLLISLGELYYLSGDFKNALFNLKKANDIEKLQNRGLDIYAAVLYHERKISDLERLIPTSLPAELNAEMCTAIAYLLFAMKNYSKALYMAQRACTKDPKSVEPLILKGTILFDLKKYSDAVSHFREALHIAPHRYEPHKGVIDSYTALNRHREALSVAGSMYRMLPNSPRAITLYASLLVKDPAENKVIPLLKKALALDEQYLPAVFCMAEVVAGGGIGLGLIEGAPTAGPHAPVRPKLEEPRVGPVDERIDAGIGDGHHEQNVLEVFVDGRVRRFPVDHVPVEQVELKWK
ncbi:hypothetical protein M8J75_008238, partial [Diaphorina citri]